MWNLHCSLIICGHHGVWWKSCLGLKQQNKVHVTFVVTPRFLLHATFYFAEHFCLLPWSSESNMFSLFGVVFFILIFFFCLMFSACNCNQFRSYRKHDTMCDVSMQQCCSQWRACHQKDFTAKIWVLSSWTIQVCDQKFDTRIQSLHIITISYQRKVLNNSTAGAGWLKSLHDQIFTICFNQKFNKW